CVMKRWPFWKSWTITREKKWSLFKRLLFETVVERGRLWPRWGVQSRWGPAHETRHFGRPPRGRTEVGPGSAAFKAFLGASEDLLRNIHGFPGRCEWRGSEQVDDSLGFVLTQPLRRCLQVGNMLRQSRCTRR